jgi:hypothetical protein
MERPALGEWRERQPSLAGAVAAAAARQARADAMPALSVERLLT